MTEEKIGARHSSLRRLLGTALLNVAIAFLIYLMLYRKASDAELTTLVVGFMFAILTTVFLLLHALTKFPDFSWSRLTASSIVVNANMASGLITCALVSAGFFLFGLRMWLIPNSSAQVLAVLTFSLWAMAVSTPYAVAHIIRKKTEEFKKNGSPKHLQNRSLEEKY